MVLPRIVKNGIAYHTVGNAAKVLGTNTMKVKQLMGDGTLEWLNLRINGRIYITEASILAYKRALMEKSSAERKRDRDKSDA
jgi:hypothetical protein